MSNAELSLAKASELRRARKFNEAVASLHALVDRKPENAAAHHDLGIVLNDMDRLSDAEAALRRAVELAPNLPLYWSHLGRVQLRQQSTNAAVASLSQAAKLEPTDAETLYWLGCALLRQREFGFAKSVVEAAIGLDAENAAPRILLGEIEASLGNAAAAETNFVAASKLAPDDPGTLFRIALAQYEMGELIGAEQMAAGALGLDPEDHRSLGFLARVQMDLGKTGAALKTLRTLQALAPDDADVLSGLGTLLRSEGLIAESIEALRSAQSVRPDNGQILVSLGASYHAAGHFGTAKTCARQALRLANDSQIALALLGGALGGLHEFEVAQECYARLADLNPADWSARARQGWVLAEAGNLEPAREAYLRVERDLADPAARFGAEFNLARHFPLERLNSRPETWLAEANLPPLSDHGSLYQSMNATGAHLVLPEEDPPRDIVTPALDTATLRENLIELSAQIAARVREGPLSLHRDNTKIMAEITGRGPEPHVFVLSTGRCGTRSLFELLSKSSEIVPYHNFWWMSAPEDRNHLLYRVLSGTYDVGALDAILGTFLKCRMGEVLAAAAKGFPVAMINHWDTVFAPLNAIIFENARFIYLHRNPRDVFSSMYSKSQWRGRQLQHVGFDPRFPNGTFRYRPSGIPLEANIAWYLYATDCFAKAFKDTVPAERFLDLDADKLFARDRVEIERLCAFLPIGDLTPGQLRDHFRKKINPKDVYIHVEAPEMGAKREAFERYWDQLADGGRFGP